jgi:uncharacterized membrane protein HdeD (DUF308 family)
MKALSIIGIVLSVLGLIVCLEPKHDSLQVSIILFLFFLAFSITATAVSFSKKANQ